jgi:hypothetical protein
LWEKGLGDKGKRFVSQSGFDLEKELKIFVNASHKG